MIWHYVFKSIDRLRQIYCFVLYWPTFKHFGFKAVIFSPLRINGKQYIELHRSAVIQKFTWLLALKVDKHDPILKIGPGCAIGDFNHITATRHVEFGFNVLTANNVYISDNVHNYSDIKTPIMHQSVLFKGPVLIGDGAWIGENVSIIGASIGKNCVIGANSVVTNDIPDYCVAIGAPARIVKRYCHKTHQWLSV